VSLANDQHVNGKQERVFRDELPPAASAVSFGVGFRSLGGFTLLFHLFDETALAE
jgi:hypothetical protein